MDLPLNHLVSCCNGCGLALSGQPAATQASQVRRGDSMFARLNIVGAWAWERFPAATFTFLRGRVTSRLALVFRIYGGSSARNHQPRRAEGSDPPGFSPYD